MATPNLHSVKKFESIRMSNRLDPLEGVLGELQPGLIPGFLAFKDEHRGKTPISLFFFQIQYFPPKAST